MFWKLAGMPLNKAEDLVRRVPPALLWPHASGPLCRGETLFSLPITIAERGTAGTRCPVVRLHACMAVAGNRPVA